MEVDLNLLEVKKRITALRGTITKKQFSGEVGLNASYLSQIENLEDPQKPSIEALFSISQACRVSIDYILTGNDPTSDGMAQNQSFIGASSIVKTQLAKSMIRNINQLSKGIQEFDGIAIKYNDLKALERTANELSIGPLIKLEIEKVKIDKRMSA